MLIIVDGYNFLYAMLGIEHSLPISDLEADRQKLQEHLVRYRNITGERIRVVYDARGTGQQPAEDHSGVQVVYAPPRSNADDHIVRTVKNSRRPADITVVTSDRHLAERVTEAGGRVKPCKTFYEQMHAAFERGAKPPDDKAHEKPTRPDPDEIDYFLREFGNDSNNKMG